MIAFVNWCNFGIQNCDIFSTLLDQLSRARFHSAPFQPTFQLAMMILVEILGNLRWFIHDNHTGFVHPFLDLGFPFTVGTLRPIKFLLILFYHLQQL